MNNVTYLKCAVIELRAAGDGEGVCVIRASNAQTPDRCGRTGASLAMVALFSCGTVSELPPPK